MGNNKFDRGILYHIFIAVVLLIFLYAWRNPVFKLLLYVQNKLLSDVDQFIFGVLLIVLTVGILCHIYKVESRKYLPNLLFVYSFPLLLIYGYYRFCTDDFIFWGVGGIAYADTLVLPFLFLLGIKIYKSIAPCRSEDSEKTDSCILRDDPICRIEDDVLGRFPLVAYLYNDLKSVDLSRGSFSVGIAASWGKGKTSYMKLFQKEAEDDHSIVLWFNPRTSKRVEDIQEDFFRQFSEALAVHHVGFALLVNRYLSALGLVEGIAWLTAGLHLFRTLSAAGEKDRINRAIDNIGKNIYVFVDDLDRLTGAEILEVFKIIDKNADFHRTIFMTGYDKAYVNAVLVQHLGLDTSIDYTDKYFNLEVSLPEISSKQLAVFAHQYIEEWIKTFDEQLEIDTTLDAWNRVSLKVVPHLDSLRHIKRYTNLFLSRYSRVVGNIEPEDFMLLTLLRYKDIQVYNALSRGRFVERGRGGLLRGVRKLLYNRLSKDDTRTKFEKLATWDGAKQVIEALFPSLDETKTRDISKVYRRICTVDYFRLYFYDQPEGVMYHKDLLPLFSVPEEEVPDFITRLFAGDQMDRLEDFLIYKSAEEIATLEDLQRLCLLLSYVLQKDYSSGVSDTLLRLFSNEYATNLIQRVGKAKDEYKKSMDATLPKMIEIAPWEINSVLYNMMKNPDGLYTPQECLDWILRCQKVYYEKVWGTDAWSYDHALIFGQITQIDGEGLVPEAREVLVAMMTKYPNEFARELFVPGEAKISFRGSFPPDKIFSEGAMTFEQWLDQVSDEKLKYILLLIYRNTVVNKGSIWLPVEGERPSRDEEIDWLYKRLSNTYSAVPFVAGDYAMLRHREVDDRAEDEPLNNIVQISSVDNDMGYVTLKLGRGTVQMSQVLPIPIDGVADEAFYYSPIRMASVTDGTTKPLRTTDYTYYMDRLRGVSYNGQSVYDMVEKGELKFVHEVQHWLREHLGKDNLRFRGPLLPDDRAI